MNDEKKDQINSMLDQIIEYSIEQDKKSSDHYLFGVMISQSFLTFHLLILKELIDNEKR